MSSPETPQEQPANEREDSLDDLVKELTDTTLTENPDHFYKVDGHPAFAEIHDILAGMKRKEDDEEKPER